jgi:hypothetical protein
MGYLFYPNAQVCSGHAAKNSFKTNIEKAGSAVIAIFMELQVVWRRHDTQRKSVPVSHQERRCWKRLIRYLAKLPSR